MTLASPTLRTAPPAGCTRLPDLGLAKMPTWSRFAAAWERLERDGYLVSASHARTRRYARLRFDTRTGSLVRMPHCAHFQTEAHNPVYGGTQRWFAPVEPQLLRDPVFDRLAGAWSAWLPALGAADGVYDVELHQMRCHAGAGEALPTPEGLHRDGRDWVLVVLIDRANVEGGRSLVTDSDGRPLKSTLLERSGDGLWIDDRRCLHSVEPIRRMDPAAEAHRDTLVVTFRYSERP